MRIAIASTPSDPCAIIAHAVLKRKKSAEAPV